MLTVPRPVRIEFGDCDPAGIVHFPRYFFYFDGCTAGMFEAATGLKKPALLQHYGIVGFPLVDTCARFMVPSRFGDDVVIETTVTAFRRSSFDVRHQLKREGDVLGVECTETRVWAAADPAKPGAIKGIPIPSDLIAMFS